MVKILVKSILFFTCEKLHKIRVWGGTGIDYFFLGYLKELVKKMQDQPFFWIALDQMSMKII